MRVTPTSTRRSDEISLVMKAKPSRSRAWNSGTILMPWMPQTTASPARISRSFRQTARAPSMTIAASMRWWSTGTHRPPMRTEV
jgi:hypothetical protein